MAENQCYWQDADGNIWLAQSCVGGDGVTATTQTLVHRNSGDQDDAAAPAEQPPAQ